MSAEFRSFEEMDNEGECDEDSEEERKEIEIALYSQIHYEADEESMQQTYSEVPYKFNLYETSMQDIDEKELDDKNSDTKQPVIQNSNKVEKNLKNEGSDFVSLDSVEETTRSKLDVNKEDCDSIVISSEGEDKDVIIVESSEEECSKSSVREYEEEFDSDCMMLDEDISDTEGINLNIDDGQKKLLKKRTKEDISKWAIIDADRFGQPPQHTTRRYYGNSFDKCYNCKATGHMAKECTKPNKLEICIFCGFIGHHYRKCPESLCYNCDLPGHTSQACPERRRSRSLACFRCNMLGHSKMHCPDQWRQYHLTIDRNTPLIGNKENSKRFCCNCGEEGHFGYDCEEEGMEKHCKLTYTRVAQYDYKIGFRKRKRDDPSQSSPKSKKRKIHHLSSTNDSQGQCKVAKDEGSKIHDITFTLYCDSMKRIAKNLEESPQLEPISEKKKRKKNKRNKLEKGVKTKISKWDTKKDVKEDHKKMKGKNLKNKTINKPEYFPRTKLSKSKEWKEEDSDDFIHHQAFDNEWWLGKDNCVFTGTGKNKKKKSKKSKKKKNTQTLSEKHKLNRGFKSKLMSPTK